MIDLGNLIAILSEEEQQNFIRYLEKKNKRNDTKNIQLFKLLGKSDGPEDLCWAIYKSDKKAAYHALRKRLYHALIDFIANIKLEEENSVDMQLIKYILAARSFLQHEQFKMAYKILDKAEVLAKAHHLFPILNEIYHTKIQYAHTYPSVDLNTLTTTFKINQKKLFNEDQLNIVYAKIRQTLNNINHKAEVVDFQSLLDKTVSEYNIDFNTSLSFKSLYQLMAIVSISAFVTNDYLKIESFLLDTYQSIKRHKTKDDQLFYHIEVLYLIANTLFRNKKFEQSVAYLEDMQHQMMQQKRTQYKNFELKYHLLLALNYNYANEQEKAIALLEPYKTSKHPDIEAMLDIYLSLIMFYIQHENYTKAMALFTKFYHTDHWYIEKAGQEWTIKKNMIEIIIHIELGHTDLVESRLTSFKRTYGNYLKEIRQQRVLTYLSLVESYFKNPEQVTDESFKTKVENAFEWIEAQQEDIFVMSFYAWLKSKMEEKPLYLTTLELVEKARAYTI